MENYTKSGEYFSRPSEIICGSVGQPTLIRRFSDTGVYFRSFTLDSGKGGEPVELLQITDMHFNLCDESDLADPELALTAKCRKWNANGESAASAKKAMALSGLFDRTIITGDTLDYLSNGAIDMLEKYIWNEAPGAIVCLGGHELTKQMQTGRPDETSLSERLGRLESVWRHDIHYHSEVIRDKVLIVALDNSQSKYLPGQADKLRADIELARREGLVMLIFEHEPVSTSNPADSNVRSFFRCDPESCNFYSGNLIGSVNRREDQPTREVYDLITHNADVIRGIFCGHEHSAFYADIMAYAADGTPMNIPQPLLEGNVYNNQAGHVMRITIL